MDAISTELLKDHLDAIGPLIHIIVNKSLQSGAVPKDFKKTLVQALLKKFNLDLLDQNVCPVSNLSFTSKSLERTVPTTWSKTYIKTT